MAVLAAPVAVVVFAALAVAVYSFAFE